MYKETNDRIILAMLNPLGKKHPINKLVTNGYHVCNKYILILGMLLPVSGTSKYVVTN